MTGLLVVIAVELAALVVLALRLVGILLAAARGITGMVDRMEEGRDG